MPHRAIVDEADLGRRRARCEWEQNRVNRKLGVVGVNFGASKRTAPMREHWGCSFYLLRDLVLETIVDRGLHLPYRNIVPSGYRHNVSVRK